MVGDIPIPIAIILFGIPLAIITGIVAYYGDFKLYIQEKIKNKKCARIVQKTQNISKNGKTEILS